MRKQDRIKLCKPFRAMKGNCKTLCQKGILFDSYKSSGIKKCFRSFRFFIWFFSGERLLVFHENGGDLLARGAALRAEVRDAMITDAGDETVGDGPSQPCARPR